MLSEPGLQLLRASVAGKARAQAVRLRSYVSENARQAKWIAWCPCRLTRVGPFLAVRGREPWQWVTGFCSGLDQCCRCLLCAGVAFCCTSRTHSKLEARARRALACLLVCVLGPEAIDRWPRRRECAGRPRLGPAAPGCGCRPGPDRPRPPTWWAARRPPCPALQVGSLP